MEWARTERNLYINGQFIFNKAPTKNSMRIKTTMRNPLEWLFIKMRQKTTIFGKDVR